MNSTKPTIELTPTQRQQKFFKAMDLLNEAISGLDTHKESCHCCGFKKANDWDQVTAVQKIEPIVTKIRQIAFLPFFTGEKKEDNDGNR